MASRQTIPASHWPRPRSGVTSVLALMYMTLFATLALGYYASTNTAFIVSDNERRIATALVTCESGMDFLRYQLGGLKIPPLTPQDQILTKVVEQLSTALNGTANLKGKSILYTAATGTISIPGEAADYITLDKSGWRFRGTITRQNNDLIVSVTSADPLLQKVCALRLRYKLAAVDNSIFSYGVASKGRLTIGGDADVAGVDDDTIDGSILTTAVDTYKTPIEIKKNATIAGDISLADPDGNVKVGGKASIHGTTDPAEYAQYIHKGVAIPEYPTIDNSVFKPYATNIYAGGKNDNDGNLYYANTVIPPGVNPHFDKNTVIEGVLYIQMPNKVVFSEHTIVRGVIVVEKSANPKDYKDEKNTIEFSKGSTLYDMSTLPTNSTFPQSMHELSGTSILAPDTQIKFKGTSGAWVGSVVAEDITFDGHSSGTISGNIISFGDVKLNKKSSLKIQPSPNRKPLIAGLSMTTHFVPEASTYEELKP